LYVFMMTQFVPQIDSKQQRISRQSPSHGDSPEGYAG
jgi:hypothetical protein